jgi:hypothetical protein
VWIELRSELRTELRTIMKTAKLPSHGLSMGCAFLLCGALAGGLTACGGGGGGGGFVAPNPVVTPDPVVVVPTPTPGVVCNLAIQGETSIAAGRTIGLIAQSSCGDTLESITWTQVSGAPVQLIASRSPVLALESNTPGSMTLKADAKLSDGKSVSATTTITINPVPATSTITIRSDHAVKAGMDTSVRAWPTLQGQEQLTSITWSQTAGPTVTMNTGDERLLMFKAPTVTRTTVLTFKANLTINNGATASDEVSILVEPQTAPADALFRNVARVHPYRVAAKYSDVLTRCAWDIRLYYARNGNNNLCTVGTLPLIANETGMDGLPTVEQVMSRVLVSHDFLGKNFETFLRTQDVNGDFRRLLASVSVITLGSHVRPSFYQSATGGIYLDARNFWLSAEERDVVTEVPDFRIAFSNKLNFISLGRPVTNNAYAVPQFSRTARVVRTPGDLTVPVGRLLYHELAHAGDFFPPSDRALDPTRNMWANALDRLTAKTLGSNLLAQSWPLTSEEMKGLGRVMYLGEAATVTQIGYSANDVGSFFSGDVASDDYAYSAEAGSNSLEDAAMLFEEFMMSYRHGVQYDIAFSPAVAVGTPEPNIAWGQRGRIGEATIRPRVKLVLERVAPWIHADSVNSLPASKLMKTDRSWEDNLVMTDGANKNQAARQRARTASRLHEDIKRPLHEDRHGLSPGMGN